jgi:cullin-associated NEDD8-dissociated protein 1
VKNFLVEFSSEKTTEQSKQIALLSIGELGHELNLSSYGNVFKEILSAFDSKEVGVREAASFALGNVTLGSMKSFMPKLFEMISSKGSSKEYLLLCSLKENIISHQNKVGQTIEYVPKTMQLLCERAESEDEGIRGVTAECLGRLGVIDMSVVIPKLKEISTNKKPKIRAVAATAIRFTLQGAYVSDGIGFAIGQYLPSFLDMLKDKDLEVQREAILTTRTFCIVKEVNITRPHLTDHILPVLYSETKEHPDLIEEIDYGGFKVKLDQGLTLRKAVYQTLDAILDTSSHLVDMGKFNDAMKVGLADADYDVQIMTYHSYQKLAKSHPGVLLQMLDGFPALIMGSIKGHLKVAKSKEPLRAVECLRVIVQTMLTFNQVKGVELCAKYGKFYKQVLRTSLLKEILKDLQS